MKLFGHLYIDFFVVVVVVVSNNNFYEGFLFLKTISGQESSHFYLIQRPPRIVMFIFLIAVMVLGIYTYVRTYQIIHFKSVHLWYISKTFKKPPRS